MAGGAGLGLGHADLGKFGVGVGDTGQGGVIQACRQAEQRAADDDAGMVGADMGEGARTDAQRVGDVADGVDAAVGQAAQPAVGGDAGGAGAHVAGRQIQRIQVGPPAGRDQQVAAGDRSPIVEAQDGSGLDAPPRAHLPAG